MTSIIRCGGDADTTAAIVGGIVAAGVGRDGIPREWIEGVRDWPRSIAWMELLGTSLADALTATEVGSQPDRERVVPTQTRAPRINPLAALLRNLLFLLIVLFHGFRRLAPPY